MKYTELVRSLSEDPQGMEAAFRTAQLEGSLTEFAADLRLCRQEAPDNVLYAAWYYRLQPAAASDGARPSSVNWKLAIPLSVLGGLALWLLSAPGMVLVSQLPLLFFAWAPIEAGLAIIYLTLAGQRSWVRAGLLVLGLAMAYFGVVWFTRGTSSDLTSISGQYQLLMAIHLPLAAWSAIGLMLVGLRQENRQRFAFLAKSIEVFITAGIFSLGVGAFAAITMGLFAAIKVAMPEAVMRLLSVGGAGLIPVLAVAAVYDPRLQPAEQKFEQGLGKLIALLMRLLLPLTVLVLVVYLAFIPFNFMAPFQSRDILIVYNAMLFAIMLLLIGAVPVQQEAPARWQEALRIGVLVLAVLAAVVSVYALSATVYRTVQGMLTPNRLTVIGWNTINIGILALLIVKQLRAKRTHWADAAQSAIGTGAMAYIVWTVFLVVGVPLLFH